MEKVNLSDMISEIALKFFQEYKEDPKYMTAKDWIKYNFAERFDEQAKMYEKRIHEAEEEKARTEEEKARTEEEKARIEEEKARLEEETTRLKEENARIKKQIAKTKEETRTIEIEIAKNLIATTSYSLSEIAKLTGLDESELKNISQ